MLSIRSARVRLEPATQTAHIEASLSDSDVLGFFEDAPEEERAELALRALRVGCLALRDARTAGQADLVERQFERMRRDFAAQMEQYFGAEGQVQRALDKHLGEQGVLDQKLRAFFGDRGRFESVLDDFLGKDGELQRALQQSVGHDGAMRRAMEEFLGPEGKLHRELEREFGPDGGRLFRMLNPEDARTPLGQLKRNLEERFDPAREGSALWDLKRDLRGQIEQLRHDLGVQEARAAEREQGHLKGFDFEQVVLRCLEGIVAPHGDRVEDVSKVTAGLGDVGDLLVQLPDGPRIVVECKNTKVTLSGVRSIHKELDRAMQNRDARFAIGVIAEEHGTFGPLRFCAPDQVLVALDPQAPDPLALQVAYQLARAFAVARAQRAEPSLDVAALAGKLQGVARHLENVRAMKTNLTGATENIAKVGTMLDAMRQAVLDDLRDLEAELRRGAQA